MATETVPSSASGCVPRRSTLSCSFLQTRFPSQMLGKTVSHYRVLEPIGAGGMGIVYKAEDIKLSRRVALKFLPPDRGGDQQASRSFSAGGACRLGVESSEHLHDLRGRRVRGIAVHRDGAARGDNARTARRRQAARARPSRRPGDSDCGRTGCGALARNRAPRYQARQYLRDYARTSQDSRLRVGKACRRGTQRNDRSVRRCDPILSCPDDQGGLPWNGRLYVTRAGAG